MPTVDVVDLNNQVVGSVELADEVFSAPVNEPLLYQAVHHYQAGQRRGTHKTKTRREVAGSGRKPWRQKGTGRARAGSARSPLWRHGGTIHGPMPRDYSYHLPRKMVSGALRSALSARLQDSALKVVKAFDLDSHKTREFHQALERLEAESSVLVVADAENRNLALSSRNLPGVTLMSPREVHAYHVLGHKTLLVSEDAVRSFSEVLR